MISYDGLYEQLRNKGITKTDLTRAETKMEKIEMPENYITT